MSNAIRIGLVDLDTSHPQAFTRILRTMPGVVVAALWDGHDVWPDGYDKRFAAEHNIPIVCESLEDMPGHIDAAMIHGTDWDKHIDRALHFMKEGIPVLIDKPIVGSVRDCNRLMDLQAKYGSLVYGGSSLRYAEEIAALRTTVGPRDGLQSAVASGPGDFFSYGIHTTEMLQGCIGTGATSVRVTGERCPIIAVRYGDGFTGILQLQLPFHEWSLAAYTGEGVQLVKVNTERIYEPFLRNFIGLIRGEQVQYSMEGPIEAVRLHLAAKVSIASGNSTTLAGLSPDEGFEGAAFAAAYAAEKRKQ